MACRRKYDSQFEELLHHHSIVDWQKAVHPSVLQARKYIYFPAFPSMTTFELSDN